MASRTAAQMTVAKNEVAAETIAATILDLMSGVQPTTARDASAYRLLSKHAGELLELTDMTPAEVKTLTSSVQTNGHAPGVYQQEG